MKKTLIFSIFFIYSISFSQVAIGDIDPHMHAQLDVSATQKGVLIPRITLNDVMRADPFDETVTTIPTSLLVYNTGTNPGVVAGYYYWSGTKWNKIIIADNLETLSKSPWNKEGTTDTATQNDDNIYQEGKVGIGEPNMTPRALLDVKGGDALINEVTVGKGNANIDTNTAVGFSALAANITGDKNTATGYQALYKNARGSNNTATGHQALFVNTSGSYNTAYGHQALFGNNGSDNTAIGNGTLSANMVGSHNTAIGDQALVFNNGSNNTATGSNALFYSNASNNTGTGYKSLYNNKTGNNNTAVGYDSGPATLYNNLENTTAIGYNAKVTRSNTIQLGDENVTNVYTHGDFGIGTTTTNATLHVAGDVIIERTETLADATALVIDASGKVGIAPVIPPTETVAKVMFAQSKTETTYTGATVTAINAGNPITISWAAADITTNNVVDFTASDNTFTIRTDGIYEMSGFMNYLPNATTPTAYTMNRELASVGVNVTIQVQKTGTTVWEDVTSVRYLYAGPNVQGTAATIVVPPAIMSFRGGDKIQMIFKRPTNTFGLPHGGINGTPGISLPGGIVFSKGMKILAL